MYYLLLSQLLLINALLRTALSIPTIPSRITQPTLTLNLTTPILKSEVHCKSPFFPWRKINTPDCLKGLRQLPSTHEHGTFHSHGTADEFQLPQEIVKGNCKIKFELTDWSAHVESTWDTLRTAAAELVFGCADRQRLELTRGGWTTAGIGDIIVITVQMP